MRRIVNIWRSDLLLTNKFDRSYDAPTVVEKAFAYAIGTWCDAAISLREGAASVTEPIIEL